MLAHSNAHWFYELWAIWKLEIILDQAWTLLRNRLSVGPESQSYAHYSQHALLMWNDTVLPDADKDELDYFLYDTLQGDTFSYGHSDVWVCHALGRLPTSNSNCLCNPGERYSWKLLHASSSPADVRSWKKRTFEFAMPWEDSILKTKYSYQENG